MGPHVVALETTVPVPDIALTLVSTYIGMRGAPTQVVHGAAGAGEMTWASHRSAEEADLPVWRARQRCLFDHLAEVHGLLAAYGVAPAIDVGYSLPLALRD